MNDDTLPAIPINPRTKALHELLAQLSETLTGTDPIKEKETQKLITHISNTLQLQPVMENAKNMHLYSRIWDESAQSVAALSKAFKLKIKKALLDPDTITFDEYGKMMKLQSQLAELVTSLNRGCVNLQKQTGASITINTNPDKPRKNTGAVNPNFDYDNEPEFDATLHSPPELDEGYEDGEHIEPPSIEVIKKRTGRPRKVDIEMRNVTPKKKKSQDRPAFDPHK